MDTQAAIRVFNVRNTLIDSFSEFLPFCVQLFYFSNFKDFVETNPAS
jgi:hypothetical protein